MIGDDSGWKILVRADLICREWYGERVCYSCASGETHLISGVDVAVLKFVESGIHTRESLHAALLRELPPEEEGNAAGLLDQALGRLQRIGLATC